jgi:hypothetical protein
MRYPLILALVLLNLLTVNSSFAKTGKAAKTTASKDGKLGTSFKFDGSALRGKYQSSMSSTSTVENDKFLEDLLGGRTQFEDRAQKETERN